MRCLYFFFKYREREKEQEKRDDRTPPRRISPRRRTRPIPRYMVQVPKITLNAYVFERRKKKQFTSS